MDGTISLGIYNDAGKLVRVLHREAEITELTAGVDGLITQWDGKDDQGQSCSSGNYRVRGVMVGDLAVEGVDFIGNDWVTDNDSPRIRRITGLGMNPSGDPVIAATVAGQSAPAFFAVGIQSPATPGDGVETPLTAQPEMPRPALTVRDGKIEGTGIPGLKEPVTDAALGADGFVWAITGNSVKKFSKKGELVRTLEPEPGEPAPVKITAAPTGKRFFVLYENAQLQRLRGYDLVLQKGIKEPRLGPEKNLELQELFENDIWVSDRYEPIASQLKFPDGKPFVPASSVTVTLVPNPLLKDKPAPLQIRAEVDKEGSYLATTDGLPLSHISESKALLWTMIGQAPGSNAVTLIDSDGAVVEEFQIANPTQMMTFDAGSIQWTAATPSPTPAVPATPSPSASPSATPEVPVATPAPSSTPAATSTPAP